MRRPVERAEIGARGHIRIRGREGALADAFGDDRTDAALVTIPLGHDERSEAAGQGVHFEMGGRAFDVVEQAEDVGFRKLPEAIGGRPVVSAGVRERGQQFVERAVLAEVEQFVLPAEIVIEVRRGKVCGIRDVPHPRGCEAAHAEDARRGLQDAQAPGVGAA
jgi:hypothetical protein